MIAGLIAQPCGPFKKPHRQQNYPLQHPHKNVMGSRLQDPKAIAEVIRARRQAREAIYANWHTSSNLPKYWSTDWSHWELTNFWLDRSRVDGKLKIDKFFKETWQVPGTIKPLVYMPSSGGLYFLFVAGGLYYFYADRRLTVYDASMEFASDEDFVQHVVWAKEGSSLSDVEVPQEPGTNFRWWR
ncbi:hypothetical protein C8R45DRAFT_1165109 [Mycena sanguinolenta]|nr:hypothetical protein C8R45DRAFT_1165109 [Mycena sanguinolenta]